MRLSKLKFLVAAAAAALAFAAAPESEAAAKRPNFLVIVADDLGYSDLGAFGGEIDTPNLDALARRGVRLTGFHTAPTCSPTRSMLLTGVDNHEVGLGTMAEALAPVHTGRPGYEGYLNDRAATVAEVLGDAGYQTLMSGKWHLGLTEDRSPAARGFQKSFALLQGLQNHFGENQSEAWAAIGERSTFREGRALTTYPKGAYTSDYFADRMIGFLKEARSDQPVFAYLTFTAPHWPLQAPAETVAKYKGRYDAGPEALRQARLARQKTLGLVAADTEPHPLVGVADWNQLTPAERAVETRKMEVYAAMVDRLDQNVGRVLQALKDTGRLDDTIIIFLSDNGPEGSAIDRPGGRRLRGADTPEQLAALNLDNSLENLGAANSYVGYGPAWAQAGP
jgi:arylsulfatase A-like enzyme